MDEVVVEMWHGETYAGEGFRKDGEVFVRWRGSADVTMTAGEWVELFRRVARQYEAGDQGAG
jgi:hypothetical protein